MSEVQAWLMATVEVARWESLASGFVMGVMLGIALYSRLRVVEKCRDLQRTVEAFRILTELRTELASNLRGQRDAYLEMAMQWRDAYEAAKAQRETSD